MELNGIEKASVKLCRKRFGLAVAIIIGIGILLLFANWRIYGQEAGRGFIFSGACVVLGCIEMIALRRIIKKLALRIAELESSQGRSQQ